MMPAVRRNAMAVPLVLAMIAMAMALSYSLLRTQTTMQLVQRNLDRRHLARQAAMAGFGAALQRMHQSDWAGVDSHLNGSLDSFTSYQVRFLAGDQRLATDDPDYSKWPLRVTLECVGTSADPLQPKVTSTHRIEAVVQLVPRALADAPSAWEAMQDFTLYQWRSSSSDSYRIELEVGTTIVGPTRLQGRLELADEAPDHDQARRKLLTDLNTLRQQGQPDHRPLTDRVQLPTTRTGGETLDLLGDCLGLEVINASPDAAADLPRPALRTDYRLYPGGPVHTAAVVTGTLKDVQLKADPRTNPLGLVYSLGPTVLDDDVLIEGSLMVRSVYIISGDLTVRGRNVRIRPVDLPSIADEGDPAVQIAGLLVDEDLEVRAGAEAQLDGLIAVWDRFSTRKMEEGDLSLVCRGRLLCREYRTEPPGNWPRSEDWWQQAYEEFLDDMEASPGEDLFAVWLRDRRGLSTQPQVVLKLPEAPRRYHWYDPRDPLYAPHPDDSGLRWELVAFQELD